MKFIGIILLLITSIFLIACSANQASNKISNSELENLASKYGGVYIFNQKFVDEIDRREKEIKLSETNMKANKDNYRNELNKEFKNTNSLLYKQWQLKKDEYAKMVYKKYGMKDDYFTAKGIFIEDMVREKFRSLDRVLSNGKRYYTIWTTYENETGKKVKISKEFTDKIKNFIGLENYKNAGASIDMSYFYIDKDNIAIPIRLTLNFYNISKSYGLYGDEGRGISFSKERLINIAGDNVFYFDSSKNTFVKEK